MSKNKVLITGSEGFIGSNLVEEMVKNGISVKAFILYNFRNSPGWLQNIDKKILNEVEFFYGDIRDQESIEKSLNNCESLIHLAALIGIPYSYYAPQSYLETNIKGTLNCLISSRKHKLKKIIITSTSEVYGSGEYFPMDEKHPIKAQSPYAASKIASDQLSLSFYNSFEMPISIIRPFNTYGPRQSARAVIPSIIIQLKNNNNIISLGNLKAKRDFTFVTDTAKAFIKTLNNENSNGKVINLGTNFNVSIEKVVNTIGRILNKEIKIKQEKQRMRPRLSEVDNLLADNSLAKNILNWEPEYYGEKGFEKGIKKTIDWFQNEKNTIYYNSNDFII